MLGVMTCELFRDHKTSTKLRLWYVEAFQAKTKVRLKYLEIKRQKFSCG